MTSGLPIPTRPAWRAAAQTHDRGAWPSLRTLVRACEQPPTQNVAASCWRSCGLRHAHKSPRLQPPARRGSRMIRSQGRAAPTSPDQTQAQAALPAPISAARSGTASDPLHSIAGTSRGGRLRCRPVACVLYTHCQTSVSPPTYTRIPRSPRSLVHPEKSSSPRLYFKTLD